MIGLIPLQIKNIAKPASIHNLYHQLFALKLQCCWTHFSQLHIRESVDSLCRDGADTPLSLKKCNGSELSNAAAMSPFRHITWPTSVSIHDKTLKGGKIHRYNDMRDFAKTRFLPHLLLLLLQ